MKIHLIPSVLFAVTSFAPGQITTPGSTEAPVLKIAVVDTNVELTWDDTHSFDLHVSSNLIDWINTNVNTSPYSTSALNVREFYRLVESAPAPDTSAPIITLNGESTINLLLGKPYYVERGATAFDEIDGKVGVSVSGVVYTSRPQDSPFTITYTATDAAGNTSTATRTVNIIRPTWSQLGDDIDGEAPQDHAPVYRGRVSLSTDGRRVAVTAPLNDGNGDSSGHVRVYEWTDDTWTQLGDDIDGDQGSRSGDSVSLSSDGTRVAIGTELADFNGAFSTGSVRVYEWVNDTWSRVGSDIYGEASQDDSGSSVSLSSDGTRIAIGASGNDGNGFLSGHVRVYEWSNDTWTQIGQDIDGEKRYHYAGRSVSLSSDGTRVAIGAPGGFNGFYSSGEVRIFQLINNTWTQLGQVIDGEAPGDGSGGSVSLSSDGTRVAIGAPGNDGEDGLFGGTTVGVGHVRIYELGNDTWTQLGEDIDGEALGDGSGSSVSLSSDGTRIAIGASGNDGRGADSGHVRVYEWSGDKWTKLKDDIDGEALGDGSGGSVSLSGDGTRVAVSAPLNDGDDERNIENEDGENYGHVRVYELPREIKIKESSLFTISPNPSWPNVISLTEVSNGTSSRLEQKLIMNVTELPAGGANYRILRSGPNGRWIFTTGPLESGLNVVAAPPATFNRAVRVQFSNATVKFDTLAVQAVLSNGSVLRGSQLFPGE